MDKYIKRIIGTKKHGGKNDWDNDGVPNRKDCQPRNTMRQDGGRTQADALLIVKNIKNFLKSQKLFPGKTYLEKRKNDRSYYKLYFGAASIPPMIFNHIKSMYPNIELKPGTDYRRGVLSFDIYVYFDG